MNRLAKLIGKLPAEDLLLIQKDLDSGNIERLIAQRLEAFRGEQMKVCPVCERRVLPKYGLVLEFGPADLRQRATFDATDCLDYFVRKRLQKGEDT